MGDQFIRSRLVKEDSTTFVEAPDVEEIADRIIPEWHPHLEEAVITYLFRVSKSSWASQGRTKLGAAKKLSTEARHLSGDFDAEVVVDSFHWNLLDENQREALVDHELCHLVVATDADGQELCRPDGRPRLTIRGHDVEAFADEIRRHGLWRDDLVVAARAVQIHLPVAGDADELAARRMGHLTNDTQITLTGPDGQSATTTVEGLRRAADAIRNGGDV